MRRASARVARGEAEPRSGRKRPRGIGKAFERRADTPNAAPRARRRAERSEGTPIALQSPVGLARGASNDFHWTLGGLFSRNAPSGAGRGYRLTFRSLPKAAARAVLRSFFSVVVFRETKVGQSQRGKAPPDPTEKKLLTHHQIARKRKRRARLAGEAR